VKAENTTTEIHMRPYGQGKYGITIVDKETGWAALHDSMTAKEALWLWRGFTERHPT
jgi:hypothetical protein